MIVLIVLVTILAFVVGFGCGTLCMAFKVARGDFD